jgi:multiple sugar transport system permease protein/raffinose/stachyose/melibiose transport system permease protein
MPLVFLQSTSMQTITLVPQYFAGEFSNDQTKILASAVITAIPVVVAYLCLQGLFERGLSSGAIK